jgi:hypothetical protein
MISVVEAVKWLVREGVKTYKELADYSPDEILDMYYSLQ